jgi:hypothetical protein
MCYFVTLGELGYATRVTIANGLPAVGAMADDQQVSLEAFNSDGRRLGRLDPFAILHPGDFSIIDVADHIGPGKGIPTDGSDVLGIAHMVPGRFLGKAGVDIELSEIFDYVGVSDEYIDYYSPESDVSSGLAYQSTPMNDARFGGTRTTLMQSPKLLVDENLDTHLLLLNVSTSPDYHQEIHFELALLASDGAVVARHSIDIPAYGFRRVSLRQVLRDAGGFDRFVSLGGSGMVVGFSGKGSVVPLSITRDDRSKGLACDHTLPPVYYLPWWGGDARRAANERIHAVLLNGGSAAAVKS